MENLSITPRPDGQYCDPCTFRVVWPTQDVGEGLHVLTAFVMDGNHEAAVDDIVLTFDDQPEITAVSPQDEDLSGVRIVNVIMNIIERGPVNVRLDINGVSAGTRTNETCRLGCDLTWAWDTSTLPAGPYELRWTATDSHGNAAEAVHMVTIDDIIRVSQLRVTNETDGGLLEIEVYVYDNVTNAMLGCAGSAHGLGGVDASDMTYVVDATLVNPMNRDMGLRELGSNAVRFEVWEDDDGPVCPTILNPQGNDFVGASPAKTAAEWKDTTAVQTFGNVTELKLVIDRPLTR